ncbi:MAG: glycosyltransferase family 4 protein [Acidimicrobiales bacterium]
MNVAVVAPTPVPFARGGAERVWAGLHRAFQDHPDHDAELVKLPVREDTLPGLIEAYRAFAALDLSHFDLIVTSKYPAWIVPHVNHVVWMFHPLRGLYDTYHTFGLPTQVAATEPAMRDLVAFLGERAPSRAALVECFARWDLVLSELGAGHPELGLPSPVARALVHWLDRLALSTSEVVRHLALSRTVGARSGYFPRGVTPTVVYPPPDLFPGEPDAGASNDPKPLFTVSRLDRPKRLDLLIRAMALLPGPTSLLIGGTGPAEEELRALAAGDDRIRFLGFVDDHDLARHYTDAVAVPFLPADEDLGLITLEAMACATPVVTCADSGGPTEFVLDGITGLVVEPTVAAMGRALGRLVSDPDEPPGWAQRPSAGWPASGGRRRWRPYSATVGRCVDRRHPCGRQPDDRTTPTVPAPGGGDHHVRGGQPPPWRPAPVLPPLRGAGPARRRRHHQPGRQRQRRGERQLALDCERSEWPGRPPIA